MLNLRLTTALAGAVLLAVVGTAHSADPAEKVTQAGPGGYVSIGGVIFKRSDPKGGTIVAANPGGAPFSTSGDYDFGWKAGIDASAGINFWGTEGIEARALYYDTGTTFQFTTPGNFIGAGFTGPGGTLFQSEYDTKLTSFEVNWRHRMFDDQLTLLAGVRSIGVNDNLHIHLNTNVAHGHYDYDNDLLGGQVGAEWAVFKPSDPFQLNLVGKIGVYSLHSEGGIYEFQGSNFIGSFTNEFSKVAYAGEVGVTAGYHLTDNIVLRGGYQLLWLDKVSLGSNAAAVSLLNPSLLRGDVARDSLMFHGFNVGVTLTW